jgi:hypothetical protein
MAIAQWSIIFCLIKFEFSLEYIKLWACFGLVANAMALPQIAPYIGRVVTTRAFMTWDPITTLEHGTRTFVQLWWRGLGVFAAIAVFLGWAAATKEQLVIYTPSFVVFLIANFIRYQPWALDNVKIFYAVWIPFAVPIVAQYFILLWKRRKLITALLVFATVFSSLLHLKQFFFFPCPIYQKDDYRFGLWVAENTPLNVTFMSTGFTGDPVASVAGRQLYLGYPGWIDSHGLHWQGRWGIVDKIVAEPNRRDLVESAGIQYVVDCEHGKRRTFLKNASSEVWKQVYSGDVYTAWRYIPGGKKRGRAERLR